MNKQAPTFIRCILYAFDVLSEFLHPAFAFVCFAFLSASKLEIKCKREAEQGTNEKDVHTRTEVTSPIIILSISRTTPDKDSLFSRMQDCRLTNLAATSAGY